MAEEFRLERLVEGAFVDGGGAGDETRLDRGERVQWRAGREEGGSAVREEAIRFAETGGDLVLVVVEGEELG